MNRFSPSGGLDRQGMLFAGRRTAASCCTRTVHQSALRAQAPCRRNACSKWLRGLRQETKPIAEDANRIVAKSSERSEPPRDVHPLEELVPHRRRDSSRPSRNVAGATGIGAGRIHRRGRTAERSAGKLAAASHALPNHVFWEVPSNQMLAK